MENRNMRWISVVDNMPEDGETVTVAVPCGDGEYVFRIGYWVAATQRWTVITSIGFEFLTMQEVVYWLRLPLLPEES